MQADRLTAEGTKGKKNAKKVLKKLMRPESEREESCWQHADLGVLRERGKKSRLAAFLAEVSDILVPMLAGAQPQGRS